MDLIKLAKWSERWLLKFNESKCKVMHMSNSCIKFPKSDYYTNDNKIETTSSEKYLGVYVTDTLS